MKKFLLSIATVLFGATMMSAGEVNFDFANETYGLTRETENNGPYIANGTALTENGGVTITLNKTEDKNGWRLWSDGLRIYKNSGTSMTLTASENITGIEFTMAKTSVIDAYAVNGGETVTVTDKVFTVSCNASTVNLDLTCTKNNGAIVSIKVTIGGEGGGETPDPNPVTTTGNGSKESPYTVADVIALNNDGQSGVWVKGVIVGVMNYVEGTGNVFSATELTTGTNIVIAAATTGYETNYVCVQLPSGAVRENLSLVAHPEIFGKEVSVCGNLASYCGTWGVKNTKDYVLDGQSVPDPDPVTTTGDGSESKPYTVADVIALNNTVNEKAWVTGYIVGSATEAAASSFTTATGEAASASNVFIAATAGETDYTKCVPVQLPVGDLRTAINLKDNVGNLGKVLNIYGSLERYYGLAGVKTPSAYTLDGEGGGDTPDPTPTDTEGQGTETDPYTVADVIKLNNSGATGKWVNGIIVGVMNYDEETKGNVFSATELTTNSNIVIAAAATGYEQNYVCVQLPAGKVRDDLNLVDRPGNLGKEVSVCGDLLKYCGVWGVKNTTNYTIVGGLAPLPVAETASLTSFVEDQCTSNTKILGTVTVFYQSADKKYTFITDGETNLEVYGAMTNAYVNGDQLSGIIGKFSYYQNMPQMTPQVDSFGEPVHGTAVAPVEKALGAVAPADFVVIKGATITEEVGESSTTYTVSQGAASRQLFNRFNISGVAAAEKVDIVGIGAVYGDNAQLFPVSITPSDEGGISEITAESTSTVIFDLQGRRLTAPVKGINIINGRKVLVK